jgi:hypothetical protein
MARWTALGKGHGHAACLPEAEAQYDLYGEIVEYGAGPQPATPNCDKDDPIKSDDDLGEDMEVDIGDDSLEQAPPSPATGPENENLQGEQAAEVAEGENLQGEQDAEVAEGENLQGEQAAEVVEGENLQDEHTPWTMATAAQVSPAEVNEWVATAQLATEAAAQALIVGEPETEAAQALVAEDPEGRSDSGENSESSSDSGEGIESASSDPSSSDSDMGAASGADESANSSSEVSSLCACDRGSYPPGEVRSAVPKNPKTPKVVSGFFGCAAPRPGTDASVVLRRESRFPRSRTGAPGTSRRG